MCQITMWMTGADGRPCRSCSNNRCKNKVYLEPDPSGIGVLTGGVIMAGNNNPFCSFLCLAVWARKRGEARGEKAMRGR